MSLENLRKTLTRIAYADSYWHDNEWLDLLNAEERALKTDEELIQLKNSLREESGFSNAQDHINTIRIEMKKQGVDYYLVSRGDEFNNEYSPACNERLAFATGFTGSAGFSIIGLEDVTLFTDSRYTEQSRFECPEPDFKHEDRHPNALENWLKNKLPEERVIGVDPGVTPYLIDKTLTKNATHYKHCNQSPVDAAWSRFNRPPLPLSPVFILEQKYAGETYKNKFKQVQKSLKEGKCDTLILNDLPAIAWLLNLRGRDLDCTPLFLSYLIIEDEKITLFIDEQKLNPEVKNYLNQNNIEYKSFENFYAHVKTLKNKFVWLDPASIPVKVNTLLKENGNQLNFKLNPIDPLKALKNEAEQQGAIKAHEIDGVALIKFLYWLDTKAQDGSVDELQAVAQLEAFRQENPDYKGPSFDTISGAASNGAIVHYRSTPKTNKKLAKDNLYLCDSGGQYLYGTTDITRTVAIGTPTKEMCENYTHVLKGHIGVSMYDLTNKTTGAELDEIARASLKSVNLDFGHGVGHGVGAYLSVHEGPCGIHKAFHGPYEEGMIVSNEPGYYKSGDYGIRIENLIMVQNEGDEGELYFKTLTLAPMDRKLIVEEMLTLEEKLWLNTYHDYVYKTLEKDLEEDIRVWLKEQTKPIDLKLETSNTPNLKPS